MHSGWDLQIFCPKYPKSTLQIHFKYIWTIPNSIGQGRGGGSGKTALKMAICWRRGKAISQIEKQFNANRENLNSIPILTPYEKNCLKKWILEGPFQQGNGRFQHLPFHLFPLICPQMAKHLLNSLLPFGPIPGINVRHLNGGIPFYSSTTTQKHSFKAKKVDGTRGESSIGWVDFQKELLPVKQRGFGWRRSLGIILPFWDEINWGWIKRTWVQEESAMGMGMGHRRRMAHLGRSGDGYSLFWPFFADGNP